MSLVQTIDETEYPESDGRPMGETDVHIDWMIRLRDMLRYRYAGQRVYVGTDLLVYYQEGDPSKFIVPDDFVVKDCDPGDRRTFKIWEEGRGPSVVFEITSRGSRSEDLSYKPQVYARLRVPEYFLYDPTGEYLDPPLQGFRLSGADYEPLEEDGSGSLRSEELGLLLRLDDGKLVLVDQQTNHVLLTEAEAMDAARRAEAAARRAEATARQIAEAARQAAERARQAAEAARQAAEVGRQAAEADRQAAEAARQTAEADRDAAQARAKQLEAEVERLKNELAGR
jgi:Uma2 family endonuclease